jgi:hypothetical protein
MYVVSAAPDSIFCTIASASSANSQARSLLQRAAFIEVLMLKTRRRFSPSFHVQFIDSRKRSRQQAKALLRLTECFGWVSCIFFTNRFLTGMASGFP